MNFHRRQFSTIFFSLIFISSFQAISHGYNKKIILLTSDCGVLYSEDNRSWKNFNRGLPDRISPVKIQSDNLGNLFLLTDNTGIFRFDSKKNKWDDINSVEFQEPSFLSKSGYRKISAFAADEANAGRMLLATKHTVFKREDDTWGKLSLFCSDNYYTAIAVNNDKLYAGTSCNGLFVLDKGRMVNISYNLPGDRYSKRRYFYEEIVGIAFNRKNPSIIYTALNFGGGIYMTDGSGRWKSLGIPIRETFYNVYDFKTKGASLYVSTSRGIFRMDGNNKWYNMTFEEIPELSSKRANLGVLFLDSTGNYPPLFYRLNDSPSGEKPHMEKTRAKTAIYSNSYLLSKNLVSYINTIKKCGLNAIVIDAKDDWGDVCFSSQNKTAIEIGSVKKYADFKTVLKQIKKNGIYAIARIVVFKDKRLYNAYNFKYSIWNNLNDTPWKGNPREYWTDPYSGFVRNYNIEIAREAEDLGFDEIQFDYIRFPSDGPVEKCFFRYKKDDDVYRSEILAAFLMEAREKIKVPISVDIYGFNAYFRISELIGQDEEQFSEIVDCICPMAYPSHYGIFFNNTEERLKPYRIVLGTAQRSVNITMNKAVIRPYIQAFKLLSPTWGPDYINSQIKAVKDSSLDGYTLWNASGNYDMLVKAAVEGK